jgi:hypothetical protein
MTFSFRTGKSRGACLFSKQAVHEDMEIWTASLSLKLTICLYETCIKGFFSAATTSCFVLSSSLSWRQKRSIWRTCVLSFLSLSTQLSKTIHSICMTFCSGRKRHDAVCVLSKHNTDEWYGRFARFSKSQHSRRMGKNDCKLLGQLLINLCWNSFSRLLRPGVSVNEIVTD